MGALTGNSLLAVKGKDMLLIVFSSHDNINNFCVCELQIP